MSFKLSQVLGNRYQHKLLEQIESSNLPDFFGGSCVCAEHGGCMNSDKGPWNDSEIMMKVSAGLARRARQIITLSEDGPVSPETNNNEESDFSTFAIDDSKSKPGCLAETSTRTSSNSPEVETSALDAEGTQMSANGLKGHMKEQIPSTVNGSNSIDNLLAKDGIPQGPRMTPFSSSSGLINIIVIRVLKYIGKLLSLGILIWQRSLALRGSLLGSSKCSCNSQGTTFSSSAEVPQKHSLLHHRVSVIEEQLKCIENAEKCHQSLCCKDSVAYEERLKNIEADVSETQTRRRLACL
ncbi:hypothetical protein KP509_35G064100 [Ceratopteris richardii]|uniref:Uncharacterized protein n=1 Tax=Ceratopteris richardii TaxID=49495 RepID=A0A8T2QGY9_CERRI|nr:hypothetical protein KP509_35G064100 [Ceratopteris richardii]